MTEQINRFDGSSDYLSLVRSSDFNFNFWFIRGGDNGIYGYSDEVQCKKAAEYYGVEYHKFDGEFGYFKKGAWIKIGWTT